MHGVNSIKAPTNLTFYCAYQLAKAYHQINISVLLGIRSPKFKYWNLGRLRTNAWSRQEFLRLNKEAFEVYSEAKSAKDLRLDAKFSVVDIYIKDVCIEEESWLLNKWFHGIIQHVGTFSRFTTIFHL